MCEEWEGVRWEVIKGNQRQFSHLNNFFQVKCYLERIVALTVEKSLIECYDEEDKKLSR